MGVSVLGLMSSEVAWCTWKCFFGMEVCRGGGGT